MSVTDLGRAVYEGLVIDEGSFWQTPQHVNLAAALQELEDSGFAKKQPSTFYQTTQQARDYIADRKKLWASVCDINLEQEEAALLATINRLSPQSAVDHVYLRWVEQEEILNELNWADGGRLIWPVAQELESRGLLRRLGDHEFRPSLSGLIWETRRAFLRKCDIFISHITEEKALAVRLQQLLSQAFGEDTKIFVSSDYRSIGGGQFWFTEITDSLKSAEVVLVILSQESVNRRWINFEAGVGFGTGSLVLRQSSFGG